MAFDRDLFASKLRRYRDQLQFDLAELSSATGFTLERLVHLESGHVKPTGDEVLIFADVFKCSDYRFFISSDRVAPFEETEEMFRRHGDEIRKEDRRSIQEFLYLCECEEFLLTELGRRRPVTFAREATDPNFKADGIAAAVAFRRHTSLEPLTDISDIMALLRRSGLHVFRRALHSSKISGLFVNHPAAGRCILINGTEDLYRQRFTAAHEACHAFLDFDAGSVVSASWNSKDLVEVRANSFAAHLLLPDALVGQLHAGEWTVEGLAASANRFRVNHHTLLYRLNDMKKLPKGTFGMLSRGARVPKEAKVDPELSPSLTPSARERKAALLARGLSDHYVALCSEALTQGLISLGRVSEMLLCQPAEAREVLAIFGRVT